jgi:hypothetical protein
LPPETCKRIAAGTFEAVEQGLAVRADLAAVESSAVLLVADDLVGLVNSRETVLGLGVMRILVRMMLLGQLAERRFYVLCRGVLRNAQHVVGILHALPAERLETRVIYAPR